MKPKLATDDELAPERRDSAEKKESRRAVEQHHAVMREANIAKYEADAAKHDAIVRFMSELTSKQPFHGWRWFSDQDSIYLELLHGDHVKLTELVHLSEVERVRDVCCVFRVTPNVGMYIAFQLDEEKGCDLCHVWGHRRVGGIHIPTQRIGMIPATTCRAIFAVPCKLTPSRWIAYVDGKPIPDRTWGTAGGALRAARKLAPYREAGDTSR